MCYSKVMFVTTQELKSQVRDLKTEIIAVAKDLGGDVQFLNQRINELQEMLETQQELINRLKTVLDR